MPIFPVGPVPQLEKIGNPSLVLPEVLRELYLGRRTGLLHVVRGEDRVSFRFVNGEVVSGSSTSKTGRLGETMVRHGLLALQDLVRALVVVHEQRRRLGPVLREMGVIDQSRLEQALALHIHEMLLTALAWDEATHLFEEQDIHDGPTEDLTLRGSTGEVIIAVVRCISRQETVRQGLGDVDRVLVAVPNPPFRLERITLNPADGYVLSRVDGTASARDIIAITPLPVEDVERSLLGLLCTGVIEYGGRSRVVEPSRVIRSTGRPTAPPPEKLHEAAAPAAAGELRTAVECAYDGLSTKDHFQVLDLPRTASLGEVKGAYTRLVKTFHPNSHPELEPEIKSKLLAVFARICEAHEVLGTPQKRARYEHSPAGEPRPAPKPTQEPGPAKDGATGMDELRRTVERAYDGLATKDHFQILGLLRTARLADVKDAYARVVSTFPPDAHGDLEPDLKSKLQAVLTRIGEAHKVLAAPEKRAQYEQSLKAGARPEAKPALSSASPPEAGGALARPGSPDTSSPADALAAAEGHLAEGRYGVAVSLLESIVGEAQGALEQRVRFLLGRSYLTQPEWARKAEAEFLKVIRLDPRDVDARCALGKFYRERSLPERARAMFQKVVELQPGHRTALAELAAMRPSEPDSGTLFGKLLRKAR